MGLSRNKVAVSEGAAGSPPFYGESSIYHKHICDKKTEFEKVEYLLKSLFNFEGSFRRKKQVP